MFSLPQIVLYTKYITGSTEGHLYVKTDSDLVVEGEDDRFYNYIQLAVYNQAYLPSRLQAEPNSFLFIAGEVSGMREMYIRGDVVLYNHGFSSCVNHTDFTDKGHYWLDYVGVESNGLLYTRQAGRPVLGGSHTVIHAEYMDVQYGGRVHIAGALEIVAGRLEIEKGAAIDSHDNVQYTSYVEGGYLIYGGYPVDEGPGHGCSIRGAGHGGLGGYRSSSYPPCSESYGDPELPVYMGSGGGNCHSNTQGHGGGAFRVIGRDVVCIEGEVDMRGQLGSGGGGAAGGTVWIDASHIEGWGSLDVDGGTGYVTSCGTHCTCNNAGGGGGRIRTYSPGRTSKVLLSHQSALGGGGGSGPLATAGTVVAATGQRCSGHGDYNTTTQTCDCNPGRSGGICQYSCDAVTQCGGHGSCDDHGQCLCDSGYVGYQCESQCDPVTSCGGHGTCSVCGSCECDLCYHGSDCSVMCSGVGTCVADKCVCPSCNLGAYCGSTCNSHGVCTSDVCVCEESWRGLLCTVAGCPGTDLDCNGHGMCNAVEHTCVCNPGWKGDYHYYSVSF